MSPPEKRRPGRNPQLVRVLSGICKECHRLPYGAKATADEIAHDTASIFASNILQVLHGILRTLRRVDKNLSTMQFRMARIEGTLNDLDSIPPSYLFKRINKRVKRIVP